MLLTTLLFWVALFSFGLILFSSLRLWLGNRSLTELRTVEVPSHETWPSVSLVVAARNEQRNVEQSIRSLLAQDYPALQIMVVNDRSTDATGEIMDRLAAEEPQLVVQHVHQLPSGWLGKNHALQLGAQRANGEYLLFADADVVMQPTTVSRAVTYAQRQRIDHLCAMPDVMLRSWFLQLCVATFGLYLWLFLKPWRVKRPRSRYFVGIGAFNLIRAAVYRDIGMHAPIAMRPDDDIKLGKLVKLHGYRQELVLGRKLLAVEWYTSFRDMVKGLEKNAFAGLDYRLTFALLATMLIVVLHLWPFAAVFVTGGPTRLLNLGIIICLLLQNCVLAGFGGIPRWIGLFFPLAVPILLFILWRTIIVTYTNRGICWRDTHYPLTELKANKL